VSAAALICISVLISRYQILGTNYLVHLIPLLVGAVVYGLIALATFEVLNSYKGFWYSFPGPLVQPLGDRHNRIKDMPTILVILGWRLFFYANEGNEPIHVHCRKGDMECKYWLNRENFDLDEAFEYNMSPKDKRQIRKIIYEHFEYIEQ
jgi:hypothetical protein